MDGDRESKLVIALADPPSDASIRTELNRLTETQWRDVMDTAGRLPDLNFNSAGAKRGPVKPRLLMWARKEKHLPRFAATFERDVAQLIAGTDDYPEVPDGFDETCAYLREVSERLGRGPALVTLLGLICRRGKDSETGQRGTDLAEAIRKAPEKTLPASRRRADVRDVQAPTQPNTEEAAPKERLAEERTVHDVIQGQLREIETMQGELLASHLPHLTEQISTGVATDGTAEEAIEAWNQRWIDLVTKAEGVLGRIEHATLSEISDAVDDSIAATLAAEAARSQRVTEITTQISELERILETALPSVRPHVERALAALLRELEGYGGSAPGPDRTSAGDTAAPSQTTPADETPADEQEHAMPALGGSEEIPTVEAEGEQQAVESGTLSPTEPDATGPAAGNRLPVDTEDPEIRQLATDLMREGRPAEAYWVARAGGLSAGIVAALRYAAAGFAVGTGGLSSVEIANRTDDVTEELVVADDTVATTIVVSAMARAVLADTFFPLCDSLDQLLGEANLDSTWHHAFSEAVRIARTGYRHAPTRRPDHNREQLEQMRRDARHLQETLGSRIIQYQRATLVLRHLSKPEGAWGRALSLAATVQEGDARGIAQLTELAKSLSDVRDVDELIDKADSALSPNKHRRDRIIAGARRQLQRTGLEVAQVVSQAASLLEISDSSNVGSHHERAREELVKSFQALPEPADEGLAAAAIWALRDWVLDPTLLGPVVDLDSLLRASSIQIVEAPRDDQDKIDDPGQISRDTLIAAFRSPLAPGELAQKYTELGNLALAEEILVEAGLGTDGLGAQAARLQSLHEDQLEEAESSLLAQRKEQLTAELKHFKEYDDIVAVFDKIRKKEVPDPALFLEWNVWRSMVMLNYAVRVEGNFVMDLDGMPVNTAPGKVPDIEVDYGDFGVIVEVTMSSGQRQYEMEGEPVARHFGRAREAKENMYCLFIAPSISEGTLAHYFNLNRINTKHYGGKTRIVPLSVPQFLEFLAIARNHKFSDPRKIERWLAGAWTFNQECEDEVIWLEHIATTMTTWAA